MHTLKVIAQWLASKARIRQQLTQKDINPRHLVTVRMRKVEVLNPLDMRRTQRVENLLQERNILTQKVISHKQMEKPLTPKEIVLLPMV